MCFPPCEVYHSTFSARLPPKLQALRAARLWHMVISFKGSISIETMRTHHSIDNNSPFAHAQK